MKARAIRLILASLLFILWTSWLIYLTVTATSPIILSRPQFLVSELQIIAPVERLGSGTTELVVKEVPWPENTRALVEKKLAVENLAQCAGFAGPGDYILPLTRQGDKYQV